MWFCFSDDSLNYFSLKSGTISTRMNHISKSDPDSHLFMAFDWLTQNVYWTSAKNKIMVSNPSFNHFLKIYHNENITDITDLIIHPVER